MFETCLPPFEWALTGLASILLLVAETLSNNCGTISEEGASCILHKDMGLPSATQLYLFDISNYRLKRDRLEQKFATTICSKISFKH
ncbi:MULTISPECIES: hypothetical protein [unclassified Sphingobacterium]|uniref:hypothetical protein n=1 Tax=unclassified Sphingobacterium TaxID=2609468 RepID=UPI0025EDC9CD|nr:MULTISPECIES: hypothetical protein [unclassified Sphingobacterium]